MYPTTATAEHSDLAVSALNRVRQCARDDRYGMHTVTDDPTAADLILFVETDLGRDEVVTFAARGESHNQPRLFKDSPTAH